MMCFYYHSNSSLIMLADLAICHFRKAENVLLYSYWPWAGIVQLVACSVNSHKKMQHEN